MRSDDRFPVAFFRRPSLELAPALLGAELIHDGPDGPVGGVIVEVEAYCGPEDQAAHSFGGRRTARTEVMYAAGGHAYVYLIYGMYFCFNVVAAGIEQPQAVLVRAMEPRRGVEVMAARRKVQLTGNDFAWLAERRRLETLGVGPDRPSPALRRLTSGPGRLCDALSITREHNGLDLARGQGPLLIKPGPVAVDAGSIATGPRVNIDYAGAWADRPWRYWIRDNPFVSKQ